MKNDQDIDPNMLEIAATGIKALSVESAKTAITGEVNLDITKMSEPGTAIWKNPTTGEVRYTPPGDVMYSTALIWAHAIIDKDGNEIPY